MKKIIAILLVLSMMFAFVACGGNKDETPTTNSNTENTTEDQAVNSGDVDVEEPSTDENTSEEASTDENGSSRMDMMPSSYIHRAIASFCH